MYNFGPWDTNTLFALNSLAGHSVLMNGIITFLATYLPFIVVFAFAWYLYQQKRMAFSQKIRAGALALGAALIARGIDIPIRFFFPRLRPFHSYSLHQLIPEQSFSFPSGHASFFFAFAAVVYAYDRRLGALAILASVLICLARVAAGIHYPSDILAGAILGTAVGALLVMAARASKYFSAL
jgi:undecaprenyl-diphosphatase